MQQRLAHLGMRSISALVDISNYVMLELGQPNHPYDLAKVAGATLRVRRAAEGETLTTLDDVERTFTADDLLICDGEDTPVGIAGIMGGGRDQRHHDRRLELAWVPRRSAGPLAVWASGPRPARFEGVRPRVADLADRFCELATEICGVRGLVAGRGRGTLLTAAGGCERRGPCHLGHGSGGGGSPAAGPIGFTTRSAAITTSPSPRGWATTEIDVIEGRAPGYRNIANQELTAPRAGRLTAMQLERRSVRRLLCGLGLSETLPLPFLAPGQLAAFYDERLVLGSAFIETVIQ
jgi:phenylalanyl-tRNA synthetase beta chain